VWTMCAAHACVQLQAAQGGATLQHHCCVPCTTLQPETGTFQLCHLGTERLLCGVVAAARVAHLIVASLLPCGWQRACAVGGDESHAAHTRVCCSHAHDDAHALSPVERKVADWKIGTTADPCTRSDDPSACPVCVTHSVSSDRLGATAVAAAAMAAG
jgi:hypothetical protein